MASLIIRVVDHNVGWVPLGTRSVRFKLFSTASIKDALYFLLIATLPIPHKEVGLEVALWHGLNSFVLIFHFFKGSNVDFMVKDSDT